MPGQDPCGDEVTEPDDEEVVDDVVVEAEVVVDEDDEDEDVGASPRKIPDRTAFRPALLVTVIAIVPPAVTLTGKVIHAPLLKSLDSATVWDPLPSLTVTVSRRPRPSQSTA